MDILFRLVSPPAQIPPSAVPMVYPLKPRDSYFGGKVYVFDIPRDNTVGSLNVHYSSLTAIEFDKDGKLGYKRIKRKRDIDILDGGFVLLRDRKMLGWNQGRGYQLIDLEHKKVLYWSICDLLEERIMDVQILDESKMLFVFAISGTDTTGIPGNYEPIIPGEEEYVIFRVLDLSGKKVVTLDQKIVGKRKVGFEPDWSVHDNKIYYYFDEANRLFIYDNKIELVKSPLVEVFNKIAAFGAGSVLGTLLFHPTLSFAIIGIGANDDPNGIIPLYYIALIDNDECKFIPMFGGKLEQKINKFFFSPDGNWLVFQYSTEYQGPPHYYFMKVNPQNPVFLESPRYLGKTAAKHGRGITTAWSTNPTSFVVSDGTLLYRWDMEKADKGVLQNGK